MKKSFLIAISVICITACARNEKVMMPIQESLTSERGREVVNPDIPLVFGKGSGRYKKTIGTYTSNKKTNAFAKSDKSACEWAFLSAIKSLQSRAESEGGKAVVNIKSYYKKNPYVSTTEYECHAGTAIAGVALRGTVVK